MGFWRGEKGFWAKLISKNDADVSMPYMILMSISIVLIGLSIALICYHCFYHGKGIDGETVKLILGLFGGGVLNAGASYFRRATTTDFSRTTSSVSEIVATSQPVPPPPPPGASPDEPFIPPGPTPGRARPAPAQGEKP